MRFNFFAFGSFSEGQIHHSKICNLIVGERRAYVRGEMYRLRCGYPAMIPDPSGDYIYGNLYELEAPETLFPILDSLLQVDGVRPERSLFNRSTLRVQIDNFSQVEAQSYCLNPKKKISAYKKITGGEWQKDLYQAPPINSQLQERQKEYIGKLSQSKGRDIVPIKLDLYRELMNLELIVDKGRRLALTPLGKEAALFMNL